MRKKTATCAAARLAARPANADRSNSYIPRVIVIGLLLALAGPTYGQLAYWRFEEASGTTALDSGPNGLNGTLSGWEMYVPFRVTDVPVDPVPQTGAMNGQSLDMNWVATSIAGRVIVPDTAGQLTMGDQDFTIEAWVKLSSLSNPNKDGRQHLAWKNKPNTSNRKNIDYAVLVQRGDNAGTPNFGKTTGFTGRELQLYFGDGTAVFWSVTSNLEINDTTNWHYISVAYDTTNDVVRFGIDCQFETISFTQQPRTTNTGPLVLGAANTGSSTYDQGLRGRIDEVRMTKSVLPLGSLLFSVDCNSNGIPDRCQVPPYGTGADCNSNGIPDACDVPPLGTGPDCNGNGIPDNCDVPPIGTGPDCNSNGIPDACDVPPLGTGPDCNSNGVPDECEPDCNGNGVPDDCDVPPIGTLPDVDGNGVPDSCQPDCNSNGVIDACELPGGCGVGNCGSVFPAQCGTGHDLNGNGILDACEPDCNGNQVPDDLDIANHTSQDCSGNGVPDECEIWVTDGGLCPGTAPPCSRDLNHNGIPDECEDCNGNGIFDDVDIASGTSQDCQPDGVPDECQLSPVYALDDGHGEISVRADGTYMAWLNQFTVVSDFDTITHIEINFHESTVGKPVTLYLWSDANGDGNPTDAHVVGSYSLTVEAAMASSGYLVRIDIPDTFIGPNGTSFFVGAIVDVALGSGDYPARGDLDPPSFPGRSWLVGASQPINPNNITAGAVEFGLFENRLPWPGNWMIRPIPLSYTADDCNANGIPDDCDVASGASLDCQPDGIPDECQLGSWQTTLTYKIDDNTYTKLGWGLEQNGYIAWMNRFTVLASAESINLLRFAYGELPAGVTLWVYLWSDPNGDGNPSDAQVLAATEATTCGTGTWCDVSIPPTYVGPAGTSFFVGAILDGQSRDPVTMDGHTVLHRTWVVARFAGPIDPNNLSAGADYLGLIDNYNIAPGGPYAGTAFIRAKGCQLPNDQNANGIPDECDAPRACCYPDGSCLIETQVQCGGLWGAYGSTCTPNTCPQPTGSCCQVNGACTVTLQADCTASWTMFGTCTPNPCPSYVKGDVNCDQAVNPDDISYFVAALIGGYTGCDVSLADMNSSGTVDGLDIQGFVSALLSP